MQVSKVFKAEKILMDNIDGDFPGIDFIAKETGLSPTKLKKDFKVVFGTSVLKYFREKQMLIAKDLLHNEDVLVKELAHKFGYENAGKFSIVYKKYFRILPSQELKRV
jgi:AraC-like DNA-binding protein